MKKLFISLSFFAFFISSEAQTIDSVKVKDSWDFYGYNEVPSIQTIDSFSTGHIQCTFQRWWSNQDWKNTLLTSYQYDPSFNEIEVLVQKWSNGNWINHTRTLNGFDVNNRKTSILNQLWESNQWTTTNSYSTIFDVTGNVLETIYWSDPGLEDGRRTTHFYDSFNHDTLVVGERFENGVWVLSYQSHYQYDQDDNLVYTQSDSWLCFWMPRFKEENTYNTTHHLLSQLKFHWNTFLNEWIPDSRYTFYPDSLNHDTLNLEENWDGTSWSNSWRRISSYTYFPGYFCRDQIQQEYNPYHWTTLGQSTYCYDTTGNLLSSGGSNSSNSYTYDSAGNEIVYRYHWYNNGGNLIAGTDSTFYMSSGQYHISIAGDLKICRGDSLPLGMWGSGFTSSLSFQWSPAPGLSSDTILNPLASPDTTTYFQLYVLNSSILVGSYMVYMTVYPVPDAHIIFSSVDTISICSSAILISDTLNQSNHCYWYFNGIQQGTQWGNSCMLPVDENGQYVLQSSNQFSCYAYDTLNLSFLNHPAPAVNVSNHCNQFIANSPTAVNYQWYRFSNPIPGANNDTLSVTGNENYRVLITDINGCTNFSDYVQITPISVNVYGNAQCHDSCSGWLEALAYSGEGPYTYQWSTGDTTFHVDNLCPAASYSVVITDTRGCTASGSDSLANPTSIASNLQAGFLSDIDSCDALAIAYPSGGMTGQYYYEWSNGSHQQFAHLCYGWNEVTICVNNNCMITDSVFISLDTIGFSCDVSANFISPVCTGSCDGNITTTVNQGTQPLHYLWSNGSTQSSLTSLCDGNYSLFVLDSNGCADSITGTISSPPPISIYASILTYNPNDPCSTQVQAIITGGVPPYSDVHWCNGTIGNQTYTCPGQCIAYFTDSVGCIYGDSILIETPSGPSCSSSITFSDATFGQCNGSASIIPSGTSPYIFSWSTTDSTSSVNNLCPGVYYYSVTDSFGCTINDSILISGLLPSCSVSILTTNQILCNGDCNGSLTAVANGVPAFHYVWSTQDTTATINNLCAGVYSVVMTDSVGCIDSMTVVLTEPSPILSTINANYLNCICIYDIQVTGGTPPYTYLWCDGSIGQQLVNCMQGICIVNIVDANGCTIQDTIIMNPPPPLTIALFSDPTTCGGCTDGTASTVPLGGVPPYTYQWSTGETTSSISGLGTGVYTVCVTDLNQCTVCDTVSVAEDPTGIVFYRENNILNIYPNPFSFETILEINPSLLSVQTEFILTDPLGNVISKYSIVKPQTIINRKNLAAGIYFYRLDSGTKNITNGKLIVVQ